MFMLKRFFYKLNGFSNSFNRQSLLVIKLYVKFPFKSRDKLDALYRLGAQIFDGPHLQGNTGRIDF